MLYSSLDSELDDTLGDRMFSLLSGVESFDFEILAALTEEDLDFENTDFLLFCDDFEELEDEADIDFSKATQHLLHSLDSELPLLELEESLEELEETEEAEEEELLLLSDLNSTPRESMIF
jgi:hypothetical protein